MNDKSYTFQAADLTDTDRLGAALARALPDGVTVSLRGTLGAGKTRLVQAIAAACGMAPDEVVSPTFVLCQHYYGAREIDHLDAYRLAGEDEFLQLGVEELFAAPSLTIVEWGDRVAGCLPPQRVEIDIRITGETGREFQITGRGEALATTIEALRAALDA